MVASFRTCLLIDDNYIDSFVTSKILESSNFAENIVVRQSPADAIDFLCNSELRPDAIFLDIRMPQMSGFEFLDEYDRLNFEGKKDIKVYMLSSSLDPTDMDRSVLNKYITQFIHKPITHKALEELAHDLSC